MTDRVLEQIDVGIGMSQAGDRDGARRQFAQIWEEIGVDGDPLHRCSLAHSMADVQDETADELQWDLRALEAAGQVTDARAHEAGMPTGQRGLFPSLHLNLADGYRRLGDIANARRHVAEGLATADSLGEGGYADMIRGALDRMAAQVAEETD